jgi:DNA-binding Lrp family transcriptional regulator
MEKLDLKDRKILYHLDLDSRQSFAQIGKKIGLHKDSVALRVKKFQEKGIIKNFYTVIDASKLGYISFRLYFVFQYLNPQLKQEVIDYFIKNKYTYCVGLLEGTYDLAVIMWVKNAMDFYSFYETTLKKYGYYFKEIKFSFYVQLFHYKSSFLLDEPDDRTKPLITGGQKKVDTDDLDLQILEVIATNARTPTIEIAEKLNSTAITINNRIKKLMKNGVIQGFRVNLDYLKLGYQLFKVDIYLKEYKNIDQIANHIKSDPHLFYICKTAGHADLELEIYVETINQLHQIMEELTTKFPGIIKSYNTFNILMYIKRKFMPGE